MAWGDKREWLEDIAQEQGYDPPALRDRTVIHPHLDWIWRAFHELSTDRQLGMSAGPIPWSSMDRYARRHDIADDRFDRFVAMLRAMDQTLMAFWKHQSKTQMKAD